MYWIQFRLQFFYWYSLFIQEIVIIKATRLQAWAPARGGGKSKPSPPPLRLDKKKEVLWLYWRPFCYFFSFWRLFHHVGAFLLLFTSWWGPFLGLAPPTKISAGTHDCKGSRACSSEFFCVTTI